MFNVKLYYKSKELAIIYLINIPELQYASKYVLLIYSIIFDPNKIGHFHPCQ